MKVKLVLIKKIGDILKLPLLIIIILISLIWDKFPKSMTDYQFVLMILSVGLILCIISIVSIKIAATQFKIEKDKAMDEISERIKEYLQMAKGIINISQRLTFIDDDILGVFEKQAKEIWVITTTLEKDIGSLKDSVFQNLAYGKNYLYFTPHSSFPGVENVEQNKLEYKRIYEEKFFNLHDEEKKKIGQYRFLEFPRETLLFTSEIVIHNPSDINNRRAFTYVETKSSKKTGEELVEISPDLTTHIVSILRPIKDKEETISKELFEFMWKSKLNKEDNLQLMAIAKREQLISQKDIQGIIKNIDGLSSHDKLLLELILERFVVFKD